MKMLKAQAFAAGGTLARRVLDGRADGLGGDDGADKGVLSLKTLHRVGVRGAVGASCWVRKWVEVLHLLAALRRIHEWGAREQRKGFAAAVPPNEVAHATVEATFSCRVAAGLVDSVSCAVPRDGCAGGV
jgi:hypothetical protein